MFRDLSDRVIENRVDQVLRVGPGSQIIGYSGPLMMQYSPVPDENVPIVDGSPPLERVKIADGSWLVWFGGRRTPIGVAADTRSQAITKARKLKRRGGDNVVSARQATAAEKKTASKGGWIRTGPKGEAPGKSKLRGKGPKPKGH